MAEHPLPPFFYILNHFERPPLLPPKLLRNFCMAPKFNMPFIGFSVQFTPLAISIYRYY